MNVKQAIAVIVHDVETGLHHAEDSAASGIVSVWNWSKGEVISLLPTVEHDVLLIAEAAVERAAAGGSREMGDILQTMIQLGEADGRDLLTQYGEGVLNVIAAIAKSKAAKAAV